MKGRSLLNLGVHSLVWILALALTLPVVYGAAKLSGTNVRVTTADFFPDGFQAKSPPLDVFSQNEPHIAQSPLDPDLLAVGANDMRAFGKSGDVWQSLQISTDGGARWPFQTLIPGFPGDKSPDGQNSPINGNQAAADPMVAFDRHDNLYYAFIAFQRTPPERPEFDPQDTNAIAVAKYMVTGGNPPVVYLRTVVVEQGTVGLGRQEDKDFIAVDNWTTSPHEGNVYLCWARFTGFGADRLLFAASEDQGETWRLTVVHTSQDAVQGCSIAVAPNGDVLVAWRTFSATGTVVNPQTSAIFVAKSTDEGRTFSPAQRVAFFRDYRQVADRDAPAFRTFANTWLAADGTGSNYRVFLAWQERDLTNTQTAQKGAEVAVQCSPDQGGSWVALPRPHPYLTAHQIMPALAAAGGKLSIVWYDSRSELSYNQDGPVSGSGSGSTALGMDVFYNQRTSVNCSGGWERETKMTSRPFNPNLFASARAVTPFIGDYIAVAADARRAVVVWTDNRDINGTANAGEDDKPLTNDPSLINVRSRDSNIYFQSVSK